MHVYRSAQQIFIPSDVNLTELLHSSANQPLPENHVIAADNLEDRLVTIGELRDTAGRLAHGLKSAFQPRDQSRWAIIVPNGITFIEAVHAVLWLDGIFCPINHELQAPEIGYALSVSKVDYAIVWSQVVPRVHEAFRSAKESNPAFMEPKIIVALGRIKEYPSLLKDFLSSQRLAIPHHPDTRNRLASIHLSSGTTGKPKGVGLSHYNYVSNVCFRNPISFDTHSFGQRSISVKRTIHCTGPLSTAA
jgi:acyl-CoA synthetase (AMP-forming)/AMP-acid ligase II